MLSDRINGLAPFINEKSRVLILGSMPSVQSLKTGFFYMHRQNRMWQIIASLVPFAVDESIESRKKASIYLNLAFSDVIQSCIRQGSLDSAIRDVTPSDINSIVDRYTNISRIVTAGAMASKLFKKHIVLNRKNEITVFHLPSTSPANTRFTLERLTAIYKEALVYDN